LSIYELDPTQLQFCVGYYATEYQNQKHDFDQIFKG